MLGRYSDEHLIEKALRGNERAWTRLVKRYEKRLYNRLLRIAGQPADASDLLQEVFMSVYRNLPQYRGNGVFVAWLFRICASRVADFYRQKYWRMESATAEYSDDIGGEEPEAFYHLHQQNRKILGQLRQLPLTQRQVIELKVFQQFTFEEISVQLDTSIATAKTRFYAGLKKLRESQEVTHEF